MVTQVLSACPSTKLVLSGYSQGGQLVHNAAAMLPASTMAKVSSVVIFGDPQNGKPVANVTAANVKIICHPRDNICQGGDLIRVPHLTYGLNAADAAQFVGARSTLGMDNAMTGANSTSAMQLSKAAARMGIAG
jgi:cutinase